MQGFLSAPSRGRDVSCFINGSIIMESRIERHRKPDSIKIDCDTTHIFSGVRNIIIKKIGRNATITTSDSFKGRIVIQGDVGKDVQFNLNGEGNIKFKTAPPSSVLNSINFLGTFDISTPPRISSSNDWAQQNREKGYSYDRYSDSRRDRRPDSRYLRDREVTLSSLSIRTSNLTDENNKPEPLLNAYLPSTQAYINSFKGKKSNLEMLDKLELSKKEEQQLEKYMDPITCVLMNRPVTLNGIL